MSTVLFRVVVFCLMVVGCHARSGTTDVVSIDGSSHQLTSSGAQIFYQVFGDGPPLLIINGGFGSDSVGYEGLAQRLARDHRVILFDRRGTGRSTLFAPSEETITMDLMVADMEAIRQELGVRRWNVLGHSFGGMLASYYTTQHPEAVQRLVLSSSSGVDMHLFSTDAREHIKSRLDDADRTALERLEAAYEAGDTSESLLEQFSTILARAYVYHNVHSEWVAARLQHSDTEIGGLVTQDLRRIGFDCKPALETFGQPVLIIQGQHDVLPLSIAERAQAVFTDARLVILDECGHYGWIEQEAAYISAVLGFLNE